jgi:hypothetical protein
VVLVVLVWQREWRSFDRVIMATHGVALCDDVDTSTTILTSADHYHNNRRCDTSGIATVTGAPEYWNHRLIFFSFESGIVVSFPPDFVLTLATCCKMLMRGLVPACVNS